MKKLIIALFVGSLSTMSVLAEKEGKVAKEITATGTVVCAHCDLDVVSKCQKAIKTRKGKAYLLAGDKVAAFFKADETKKAKQVTVTGKPTGKEGEHVILTATKIKVAKASKKKEKSS